MQCYQYLAAITAVSNAIDNLPGTRHKMPHSVVANWMEENGIEAEDILLVSGSKIRTIVMDLIEQNQPQMPHAA